jgi:hypothetical protein
VLGGGSPGPQKICTQDIVQQLRVAVRQRQYHAVPRIVAESFRGRHHGPRRWRCRPRHGCGADDGAAAVAANRSMKGPKFPPTAVKNVRRKVGDKRLRHEAKVQHELPELDQRLKRRSGGRSAHSMHSFDSVRTAKNSKPEARRNNQTPSLPLISRRMKANIL